MLRCPDSDKAVIVTFVNVFLQDVEALQGFYVPTLLWSLARSFTVQQALRETFGTDLIGKKLEETHARLRKALALAAGGLGRR